MNKSILSGVTAAISIGLSAVFLSLISKLLNPILILTFAYLTSVVFLFILAHFFKERLQFNKLLKNKKDLITIIIGRSLIGSLILVFGFKLTSAIHALLLLRTEPIFVIIASYFLLKEKINLRKIILILSLIFGAFLIITSFNLNAFSSYYTGDFLIVLAMAILGYTYIAMKNIMQELNSSTITLTTNLIAGIVLFPSVFFIPFNLTLYTLGYLSTYILFFYVFGLYFFFKSLKSVKPWIVSSLLTLELISGAFLAYFWLGEKLNSIQLIGGLIILITSYLISKE